MTAGDHRRTMIVAGGTSGIGLATARRLLDAGHRVALFGHTEGAAQAARSTLSAYVTSNDVLIERVDVRSSSQILAFNSLVVARWGHADTMIYCAGISPKGPDGVANSFAKTSIDEWNDVIATNLTGAMLCCQATIGAMSERGFGRIVFIGSLAGRTRPAIAGSAYAASKAGLAGLARSLVGEFASSGVTINTVSPGRIITPMTGDRSKAVNSNALKRIPAGRPGEPEEVAAMVAFLVSEEAAYINGSVIDINGGEYVPA